MGDGDPNPIRALDESARVIAKSSPSISGPRKIGDPALLLRCIFVLSAAGIYISAVLSLGYFYRFSLPCGAGSACALLQGSPASKFLGIPLPLYGLLYFSLSYGACFAVNSMKLKGKALRRFVCIPVFAMLFSLALMIRLVWFIGTWCPWCYASAIVTAILSVAWSLLATQQDSQRTATRSEE